MEQFAVCLASLILFFSSTVTAESTIYHWVDAQGKNHFSDTVDSSENSEKVNIREHNIFENSRKNAQPEGSLTLERLPNIKEKKQAITYQATITSPTDKESIRSNNGTLNIQVSTVPEKENTQKLQLIMDGKKLGAPQISTTIGALNIDRGTHQIQVQLLAEDGSILAKTQIVTIYLQRITVNRG